MKIIEIIALDNGAHRNQTSDIEFVSIPDGWAVIPDDMECENFPFGEVTAEEIDGVMTVVTREMTEEEILQKKVKGQTAIPTGIYHVYITYSPKYKKQMPLIDGVKGFSGIRIHSGNTAKDTEGCLIVGLNTKVGMVTQSRKYYNLLFKELSKTKERIIIDIQRKYTV